MGRLRLVEKIYKGTTLTDYFNRLDRFCTGTRRFDPAPELPPETKSALSKLVLVQAARLNRWRLL